MTASTSICCERTSSCGYRQVVDAAPNATEHQKRDHGPSFQRDRPPGAAVSGPDEEEEREDGTHRRQSAESHGPGPVRIGQCGGIPKEIESS
jgi:hypothetical protein